MPQWAIGLDFDPLALAELEQVAIDVVGVAADLVHVGLDRAMGEDVL